MKLLSDMQKHPARGGGTLKITSGRDRENRCQFVIEWQDTVAHCSKCGVRVGEGWPAVCEDKPTCTANPGGRGVCGGEMSKKRAQVFFTQPEKHVAAGYVEPPL